MRIDVVKFVMDKIIEIESYSEDCSLAELACALDKIGSESLTCDKCGKCCCDTVPILGLDMLSLMDKTGLPSIPEDYPSFEFPQKPDMKLKHKSIRELNQMFKLSNHDAELFYEYNSSEPVTLRKKDDGQCIFSTENLCGQYQVRPFICQLYQCRFGEKLSYLKEMIVSQGIWHSYFIMGWINEREISHNPFLSKDSFSEVLLKSFELNIQDIQDKFSAIF